MSSKRLLFFSVNWWDCCCAVNVAGMIQKTTGKPRLGATIRANPFRVLVWHLLRLHMSEDSAVLAFSQRMESLNPAYSRRHPIATCLLFPVTVTSWSSGSILTRLFEEQREERWHSIPANPQDRCARGINASLKTAAAPPPGSRIPSGICGVRLEWCEMLCVGSCSGRASRRIRGRQPNQLRFTAPHNLERALSGYRGDAEDVLKRLAWCSNKNNQSQIYDEPVKRRLGTNYGC